MGGAFVFHLGSRVLLIFFLGNMHTRGNVRGIQYMKVLGNGTRVAFVPSIIISLFSGLQIAWKVSGEGC